MPERRYSDIGDNPPASGTPFPDSFSGFIFRIYFPGLPDLAADKDLFGHGPCPVKTPESPVRTVPCQREICGFECCGGQRVLRLSGIPRLRSSRAIASSSTARSLKTLSGERPSVFCTPGAGYSHCFKRERPKRPIRTKGSPANWPVLVRPDFRRAASGFWNLRFRAGPGLKHLSIIRFPVQRRMPVRGTGAGSPAGRIPG
jgi:hypothetical protein